MKFFLTVFVLSIFCVSCSTSDDTTVREDTESLIVGTWRNVQYPDNVITYRNDGSFLHVFSGGVEPLDTTGVYEVEDDILIMTFDRLDEPLPGCEELYFELWHIQALNSSAMQLFEDTVNDESWVCGDTPGTRLRNFLRM